MKVVFMGTPEFAVPSLEALLEAPSGLLTVAGVVTQPDRPAGRGRKLQPPPVKKLALDAGIPLLQTHSIRKDPQALAWIRERHPDLIVVAAFGQILPRECFDLPNRGTINVHASILPKHRGAAPIAYSIMAGERTTGVSIMMIEEGLDSGDVLSTAEIAIGADETRGELEVRLARRGAELLLETIPGYLSGEIRPRPQDHSRATSAPRLKKEDGWIDWNRSAQRIHDQVRACNPWPGGQTSFGGQPVKVWESRLPHPGQPAADCGRELQPGSIAEIGEAGIAVRCGDGCLLLRRLQPPNRNRLRAKDFANGFGVREGDAFG